ncbi:hypothetical protein CA850_23450 [Micromonospora echinospora]|uniref:Amidase n=1 Tax=Micromonospora echinospora TaxID=1877 RepID=A0A1C4YTD7_MICEC|nr:hypothetical protein [Micromonospora echinospora]OZV77404.1 hypothetical protein CA850_23450 [Micromonospora echinospora]SCF24015.1 hypothetical protein GA0070618_4349 [Micromonospora echinospora]
MTTPLTPPEAAALAARAGLLVEEARHAGLAAATNHIHDAVNVLRELDFGDTPPAFVYEAGTRQQKDDHAAA